MPVVSPRYLYSKQIGDPDANAWMRLIAAQGATISGADRTAINNCVVGLKSVGYWNAIYSMGLHWWGASAPNRVRAKIGGLITLSGSPTHGANYMTFTGGSYADLGFKPSDAGITPASCGFMIATSTMTNGAYHDLMCVDGTNNYTGLAITGFGSHAFYSGSTGAGQAVTTPQDGVQGIYAGNRLNANGQLYRQNSGGRTLNITNSSMSGGSHPSYNFFYGAANSSGAPAFITSRPYMFWLVQNQGVSATVLQNALVYIYAMLATRGL